MCKTLFQKLELTKVPTQKFQYKKLKKTRIKTTNKKNIQKCPSIDLKNKEKQRQTF